MTSRTGRTEKTKGVDFGIDKEGIDIGIDFKGFKASISTSGVLKLGIGIAAVELNLKDPNESKVSYGFGVYEIEGKREGCTVELIYSIAGQEVKRETRKIPECEEEDEVKPIEEEEPKEPVDDDYVPNPPKELDTNLTVWAFFNYKEYRVGFYYWSAFDDINGYVYQPGFLRQEDVLTQIYKNEHRGINFRNYVVKCKTTYLNLISQVETVTVIRAGWNTKDRYPDDLSPSIPNGVFDRTSPDSHKYMFGAYFFQPEFPFTDVPAYDVSYANMYTLGDGTNGVRLVIGKGEEVKRYISEFNQGGIGYLQGTRLTRSRRGGQRPLYFTAKVIKPKRHLEDAPPTFTDKRKKEPIMNEDCCAMIERIYTALDIDEILDKEVKIPNSLMVPGGTGVKKYNTYLQLFEVLTREIDYKGGGSFRAKVTDVNAAKEGNQSVEVEFANSTAALKQIVELLLENKGDSATRLNLMMRTAVTTGQILNVVSIVSKNVENLINFVGMPVQETIKYVSMAFDFTFGKRQEQEGKGFANKNGASQEGIDALDINTEEATEALLPKFMQDVKQPVVYKQFKRKQSSLLDIIRGRN